MNFLLILSITTIFWSTVGAEKKRKVTLQPFRNEHGEILGPIGLGNPTQFTYMHLDTTTPSFFLVDANCKTNGCTKNRKGFNTKASSTFHELFYLPYSATYDAVKSSGRFVTDCLTALGIGKPPRIPFPLVDRPNGQLVNGYGDGVLGLGFQPKGSLMPYTFFNLLTLLLDEPVITWHMEGYNYTTTKGINDGGLGTYGGNDLDNCENDYTYYKTTKPDQWTLTLTNPRIGRTQLQGGELLIRPGPQRVYGPKSEIEKIYRELNAQKDSQLNEYTVDCSRLNSLPKMQFKMSAQGKVHEFGVNDYVVKAKDQPQKCILLFAFNTPQIGLKSQWVFGDVLMRSNCLQLNVRKHLVGLATPKVPSQS